MTRNHVLRLGLDLECPGSGLGLEGTGLDYLHVEAIFWRIWCQYVLPFSSNCRFSFAYFSTLFAGVQQLFMFAQLSIFFITICW
jgi:hypothetical protein